jgi:hypothetical protein
VPKATEGNQKCIFVRSSLPSDESGRDLSARVVALWRNLVEYSASLDIPPELLGRGWTD